MATTDDTSSPSTSSEISPLFYSIAKFFPNLWPDAPSANSQVEKNTEMSESGADANSISSLSIDVFCDCSSECEQTSLSQSAPLCHNIDNNDIGDLNAQDSTKNIASDCQIKQGNSTEQTESALTTLPSDLIPPNTMDETCDSSDSVSLDNYSISSDDSDSLIFGRIFHDQDQVPLPDDSIFLTDEQVLERDQRLEAYHLFIQMITNQGQHPDVERMDSENSETSSPPYPVNLTRHMECDICFSSSEFGSRVCCRYKACNDCLDTYIALKIKEANVHIQCPNDKCNGHIHRNEIRHRLSEELRGKYDKFLIDANKDPCKKTCPSCSAAHSIDPDVLYARKKLKNGLEVSCLHCKLIWCFLCQAPFHNGLTCKQYVKGDAMLQNWAKDVCKGKANAQRCPKCKAYIQKAEGCDHMKCSQCGTDFCYRCGERYIRIKFMGNHFSRYSLFGCKYRLLPQKPALRKLIRGSNFAARLVGCILLGAVGIAAGAALLGFSVFILPTYGGVKLRRHRKRRRMRSAIEERMRQALEAERLKRIVENEIVSDVNLSTIHEESEAVDNHDTQQVEVVVHRSVSVTEENAEESAEPCELYANRFTAEGTDIVVEPSTETMMEDDDNIVIVTEFKEVKNEGGYSTLVANVVSKVGKEEVTQEVAEKEKSEEEIEGNISKEESHELFAKELNKSLQSDQDRKSIANVDVESTSLEEPSDSLNIDCDFKISTQDVPTSVCDRNPDSIKIAIDDISKISFDDNKSSKTDGKISPKDALPGCFGNMFSKCSQIESSSSESLTHKSHQVWTTDIVHKKSATWEQPGKSKVGLIYNIHQKNEDIKAALWHTSSADDLVSPLSIRGDNQEISYNDFLRVNSPDCFKSQFDNSREDGGSGSDIVDSEIHSSQEDVGQCEDVKSIYRAPCSITTHL